MRAPRIAGLLPLVAATLLCSACADIAIVDSAPSATPNVITLPPIGFNHRFGNNPLTSRDAFALERSLYAARIYWEVAVAGTPPSAGYVTLSNAAAVRAARHATTSVTVVIATEDGKTIDGLLAYGSDAAQERWCVALLSRIRDDGYDNLHSAQLLVYFTESDRHAELTWSPAAGYAFRVYDNDLLGTAISPRPGQTPLPLPPRP